MIFVFDTTEFQDQKRLEGSLFRLFLIAKNVAGHRVCVPQIVVEEHARHVRTAVKGLVSNLQISAKELGQYFGKQIDLNLPNAEAELKTWDAWFLERLKQWEFAVLPYPLTTHAELLRRDLDRRKPFNEKGRGYRDALIWESILELAAKSENEIVLVSRNAGDFGKDGFLHPDLAQDLIQRGLPSTRVKWVPGIRAAVDSYLRSSLPPPDPALAVALASGTGAIDLRAWIISGLKSVCPRIKMTTEENSVFAGDVLLEEVKAIDHLVVKEARRLGQGEVVVFFEAGVRVRVRKSPTAQSELLSVEAEPGVAPSGAQVLSQIHLLMSSLFIFDESIRIDGALTFDAAGALIASDIWEAVATRPTITGVRIHHA
jgi:hypothetical protein